MRTVIFAGGQGSRISEETHSIPKPMVRVGNKPILEHIFGLYSNFGYHKFTILCGYKGHIIRKYVRDLVEENYDVSVNLSEGTLTTSKNKLNSVFWEINTLETGLNSETGSRLKQAIDSFDDEVFFATYGDGLSDVNIAKLLEFHKSHGKLATVTAVQSSSRFGSMTIEGNSVVEFLEKNNRSEDWINGGFFVLSRKVRDYIDGNESFEYDVLPRLVAAGELMSFKHTGFWQPMDTLKDRQYLENLMQQGKLPWS
jgi:glucose-1-phosphate cytidylyltransferase